MSAETAPTGGIIPVSRRVMNLAHFLRQAQKRFGSEIALVHGDDIFNWSQVDARVDAMAATLAAKGIVKGDRILVQSKNCLQMIESMFAAFRLGAVWVPTNSRQTPDEVAYLAQASGASAMICHADYPDHVPAAQAAALSLHTIISIGTASFGEDYDALVAAHLGTTIKDADVEYDDPCWFFFTSGTTGRPKAAILTHGQMGYVISNHLSDLMPGTSQEKDASLIVAPISHAAGINQLVQTARGVKTVLLSASRFDVAEAWRLIEQWKITNLFTVPTITKMLVEHPAVDEYDHSSLRYVLYAGAPMYREDQKFALKKLGPVLVQYFGLGEVTANITVLPTDLHDAEDGPHLKLGTCGYERTSMQVQIQDSAGEEVAALETGEICVCGPGVFAGYYNNPEANAKAFRNGWFRTGDLGHMDAEGFIYITGRESDMYISGGSNVYPRETEEKMLTHPAIAEAAIVGIPDATWGEVGIAVCVLREGENVSETDILGFLAPKVARYKLPRRVLFWPELPKSAYGKITKKLIVEKLGDFLEPQK